MLGELRAPGEEVAVGVEHQRGAIENELVLAADLVDVDEGARGVRGPGGQHALPLAEAPRVVRGGVDVDDEFGASFGEGGDGPVRAPRVLADGDADANAGDAEQRQRLSTRREVPLFVEHGVVRQQALVVHALHRAERAYSGGVVEVAPGVDEAHDRRAAAGSGRQLLEGLEVVGDEPGLQHQILGGVAGDRQLGEGSDVAARGFGLLECSEDGRQVAIEIADDCIDLAGSHPHASHTTTLRDT